MPSVRYVGPFDAVEIDLPSGRTLTCPRGANVDVPAEVAGRPPAARYAEIQALLADPAVTADHARRVALIAELGTVDVGAGLLAQPDNWSAGRTKTTEDIK